jgi:D-amino-acid oxidase
VVYHLRFEKFFGRACEKIMKTLFIATILHMSLIFAGQEPTVVKLVPPVLNESTVLKKVTCTRPKRAGRFNISTDTFQGQTNVKEIVNCYGHGGAGWTTLFGSVGKAIRLFQSEHPLSQQKPIRVIGSGCMGLTAAIELMQQGYQVSGISTKEIYDLCSWRAAGYFAFVSVQTSPEEQENLNEIGVETFKTYRQIEQGSHPYISSDAVRYIPVYCGKDTESGVEALEARGLIPPHEEVTLDFGGGVRHENFVKYMTYFMDTTKLMKQLIAEVKRLGIPIEKEVIRSFGDVEEEVIFNCSGMGGRELNRDPNMIPVRGHLIFLNDQAGTEHMNYMIYTDVYQNGNKECIYMFPKAAAVSLEEREGIACKATLGGTFIPDADQLTPEGLELLDVKEFQKMLDRNSLFFHGTHFPKE